MGFSKTIQFIIVEECYIVLSTEHPTKYICSIILGSNFIYVGSIRLIKTCLIISFIFSHTLILSVYKLSPKFFRLACNRVINKNYLSDHFSEHTIAIPYGLIVFVLSNLYSKFLHVRSENILTKCFLSHNGSTAFKTLYEYGTRHKSISVSLIMSLIKT